MPNHGEICRIDGRFVCDINHRERKLIATSIDDHQGGQAPEDPSRHVDQKTVIFSIDKTIKGPAHEQVVILAVKAAPHSEIGPSESLEAVSTFACESNIEELNIMPRFVAGRNIA